MTFGISHVKIQSGIYSGGFCMNRFFKALLPAVMGWILCMVLSACENFLQGSDIVQNLQKEIDYLKIEGCILNFKSDQKCGSFLSDGAKECKPGYPIDVRFDLNKEDYFFVNLQANIENCVVFEMNE